MKQPLNVLFVSRAYPPVVGGIERQNFELARALGDIAEVTVIANTRGKKYLPVFFVAAFFRALVAVRKADVVLLGDGVLSLWGVLLKSVSGKPVCSIIHGLDVTFGSRIYQRLWVRYAMNRLDALFAVGNATIAQAVARGVDGGRCHFIPNGTTRFDPPDAVANGVEREAADDEVILLTLGRLVRRKGVAWFMAEVLPSLPANLSYVVAGDGPDRQAVEELVRELDLGDRVSIRGAVSDTEKASLLLGADIFVQPNIPVDDDMEGFGLVVLEAAAAGLPVVASRLEGLKDAIDDGENGILIEPGDSDAYVACLESLAEDRQRAREFGRRAKAYVEANCLWPNIAARYLDRLAIVAGEEKQ